nr:hypothetical protein [Pseudalkalibacillus decolorationis]
MVLYWFQWVIVIAIEAIAGAAIIHIWYPSIPLWLLALVLTIAITLNSCGLFRSTIVNHSTFLFYNLNTKTSLEIMKLSLRY